MNRKRTITIALASASLAATAVVSVPTSAGSAERDVTGLDGVRGFDIGARGRTVVAEADGTISRVFRVGRRAGTTRAIAKVKPEFVAASVAVANDNATWILTAGGEGPGFGTLYLKRPGHKKRMVANVQRWQRNNNLDPFDLEDFPQDSNPYGVAALPDGSALVADAANNSVVRVWRGGRIKHIARVKPRVVEMPAGYEDVEVPPGEPPLPPAGTPMPAEAVVTSVAVGRDGAVYLGELRGFPATPETSQIWRVRPGATNAVCRPNKPQKGACRRVADGLTSVVALEVGRRGSIYAAELSKLSWFAWELELPGSEVGSVWRINPDRNIRRELSPGQVILPGAVAVGPRGGAFVSGPIFGPGGFQRVR
ncbi:MAG: ScyD/ScyE family protein [Nocardioides sp.]